MALTIGGFTYDGKTFTAQPFGYEETDVRAGLTARSVSIQVMLTATQWQSLLSTYNTWRDTRITDLDSRVSGSVGTTIAVTVSANGVSWSSVACWFTKAPAGQQYGTYVQATVDLVDAAQALAVALKKDALDKEKYYFGTWALGATTVNLRRPPETYQDGPTLQLTAAGKTYISGAPTATLLRQIEGDTTASGWSAIQNWYEGEIATTPAVGNWFPVSAPSATAEAQIIGGVRTDVYTVSITLAKAK